MDTPLVYMVRHHVRWLNILSSFLFIEESLAETQYLCKYKCSRHFCKSRDILDQAEPLCFATGIAQESLAWTSDIFMSCNVSLCLTQKVATV